MTRFILYAILGFLAGAGMLYVMAVQAGLDPFAANIRTLSYLALVVALYFGIRMAMVIRSLERRKDDRSEGQGGKAARGSEKTARSAFRSLGRDSKLDARMQARRDRVRRAREIQEKTRD